MEIEEIRKQASNENIAPEILAKLAISQDTLVRKYVARNPNTPLKTLEKLGAEFPEEIVDNPIFYLLLLENPESSFVKLSLARSCATPLEKLAKLADFEKISIKDIAIIYEIARNPKTPIETIKKLLDWYPGYYYTCGSGISSETIKDNIIYNIANNTNTPSYLLSKIAYKLSKNFNYRIPDYKFYPKTIEKFQQTTDFKTLQAIAHHPRASTAILEYLAGENCSIIQQRILQHQNVSITAINIINFMQGKFKRVPNDILEILAKDPRVLIRRLVAQCPDASISILDRLSQDDRYLVLFAIAQNNKTPSFILDKLATASLKCQKIQAVILKHPNVSPKAREIALLMRSKSPVKIPNYVLEELASNEKVSIRKKVVKNKLTPSYILEKLRRDPDEYIRNKATQELAKRNSVLNL